jgi:hypothetical protein
MVMASACMHTHDRTGAMDGDKPRDAHGHPPQHERLEPEEERDDPQHRQGRHRFTPGRLHVRIVHRVMPPVLVTKTIDRRLSMLGYVEFSGGRTGERHHVDARMSWNCGSYSRALVIHGTIYTRGGAGFMEDFGQHMGGKRGDFRGLVAPSYSRSRTPGRPSPRTD